MRMPTKWIRIFTFLSRDVIHMLHHDHQMNPSSRVLQKTLAQEITIFVHGTEAYEQAVAMTNKLFNQEQAPAESLSVSDLEEMEDAVKFDYDRNKIAEGIDVVSFLAEAGIFPSKGEAKRMVQGGGISINRKKIENIDWKVVSAHLLHDQYLLVQKGKKNYFLVKAV